jgi:hypothetical protein
MQTNQLRNLGFDLAYLAVLTKHNVKRLSRWEGKLPSDRVAILQEMGLEVAHVKRRLRFGRKADEVVFSPKKYYSDFYKARFDRTRLRETPENMRLKGFLFGYPSCCVEAFIREGYSKNGLLPRDQEILLHWACPGCRVTPHLLREYRGIHDECLKVFGDAEPESAAGRDRKLIPGGITLALQRKAAPVALGLSALLLIPGVGGSYKSELKRGTLPASPDPHLLPVEDDIDGDYLSYGEEMLRGLDADNPDTDYDSTIDGVEEALLLHSLISALPATAQDDQPYRVNHRARGLEYCEICGAPENMGFITIVNPLRGLEADVPFICLHYLEHGSLSWAGTYHPSGRVDLALVKRILLATDESHLTCGYSYYHYDEDTDQDGLGSREEALVLTNPDSCDTDGDSVKDGPQFLEGLTEMLSGLPREVRESEPYLIEHRAFGLEACDSCGAIFNMGYAEITNPVEGLTLEAPFIALHYLAHGSSAYHGTANAGRILPTVLRSVLIGTGTSHWLEVEGDTDEDGLKDEEEAHFSLDPLLRDTDGDGLPDGPELAMAMAHVISGLPEGPRPDSTYVNHGYMDGFVYCLICGERINMGYMEIVNPVAGSSCYVDYVNHHYMEHGSFFSDYPEHYRTDPRDLDLVLDMNSRSSGPHGPMASAPLAVYPNPFRQVTNIVYSLPGVTDFDLAIYDASGRLVRVLSPANGTDSRVIWDGTDSEHKRLPAGVYFCKMRVGDISISKKVILLE